MKKLWTCGLLTLLICIAVAAKEKPSLPTLVANAKYIYVISYFGDANNARNMPDDRKAITDVQQALRDLKLYHVVYQKDQADLILLIRKGRAFEAKGGIRMTKDSQRSGASVAPIDDVDMGDREDMIALYDAALGTDSAPLWRGRMMDGLDPPDMQLIKSLRDKVLEAASKKP
jgi:hypothetical protein